MGKIIRHTVDAGTIDRLRATFGSDIPFIVNKSDVAILVPGGLFKDKGELEKALGNVAVRHAMVDCLHVRDITDSSISTSCPYSIAMNSGFKMYGVDEVVKVYKDLIKR